MMKQYFSKMNNEEGVTLVELLAAIAILSIIVTAFLAFFVQAGRTNNMTNEVNEATFLAQEEMERVTYLASIGDLAVETEAINNGDDPYLVTTSITTEGEPLMFKVIVRVKEKHEGGKELAIMETRLSIKNE